MNKAITRTYIIFIGLPLVVLILWPLTLLLLGIAGLIDLFNLTRTLTKQAWNSV